MVILSYLGMAGEEGYLVSFNILVNILRKLDQNAMITPEEAKEAKTLASSLYLDHNNRKITLNDQEFKIVLQVLEFKS